MIALILLTSCTISFQNISSIGASSDLADDNLTTSPDISAEIPFSAMPMKNLVKK